MPTLREAFTDIYQKNYWSGNQSRSGRGSDIDITMCLCLKFVEWCKAWGIKSIVDLGCGDVTWFGAISARLDLDWYVGVDVVPELVEVNKSRFCNEQANTRIKYPMAFVCMDVTEYSIPQTDLVVCRDVLNHLSYANINRILRGIQKATPRFAAITHFTGDVRVNVEVVDEGYRWRPINFAKPPFELPAPVAMVDEECVLDLCQYTDKMLAVWNPKDWVGL